MRVANDVGNIATHRGVLALELFHDDRPINRSGRFLTDAIVVDVADDADDFAVGVVGADADSFADRVLWILK